MVPFARVVVLALGLAMFSIGTVNLAVFAVAAVGSVMLIGLVLAVGRDVTEERRNEQQISEQAHRAGLINELTQTIGQDLDPRSVLRRTVTALGEFFDVDRVVVRVAADEDPLGIIAEAYLGAPMGVGSRSMGWLSLHSSRPRSWSSNDVGIVLALARTVGAELLQAQSHQQEQQISKRLRELDQTKSDFVSSVSHELRTPLTNITGYLEMLVEGEAGALNADQMQLVEVVGRNSLRLLDLIEQLLTLSRIEAGNIRQEQDPVDLAAVIGEVHRAVLPMLSQRDLSFAVEVPCDLGVVTGDTGQLERVVLNLVTNAVKFTPDGGSVAAAGRDGRVRLSVSDTGIGIPHDEQDQLFTRFFRSSTARQHAIQGTGLGLAMVKFIVEGHGGSIAVESAPDSGTSDTIELPLALPTVPPLPPLPPPPTLPTLPPLPALTKAQAA